MKRAIVFEAPRTGYSIDQISRPTTIGELKQLFEELELEDDDIFILSHDRGYTYGSINDTTYEICIENEDGEWETEEY